MGLCFCINGVYFMDDKEFMGALLNAERNGDCPETLVKMATTKWQKQVAVEFILQDRKLTHTSQRVDTIYKITWGIFILTAVASVVQVINNVILPIL